MKNGLNLDNLGNHQSGRLWINECPEIKSKIIDTIQKTVEGVGAILKYKQSAVLELLLPRNASNYALLGVTYIPLDSKKIDIKINVGITDDVVLKDNIAFTADAVHIGIPEAYDFNPDGLDRQEWDTPNGKVVKWLNPDGKAKYEWDEDLENGEHYHKLPDSGKGREKHPDTGDIHMYRGDEVPE